jgi:hypothetical protein
MKLKESVTFKTKQRIMELASLVPLDRGLFAIFVFDY